MQKFTRNLLTEWRKLKLPLAGEKIIITVSGGADSTALACSIFNLEKRSKLKNDFVIAHFNHNLRGRESDEELQFVQKLADRLQFQFISKTAKAGEIGENENLEQSARNARYIFFNETAEKINSQIVLTAHTKTDQAETFLLNLLRGSGTDGLSAMKTVRPLTENSKILLVRPLLNWAKRHDTTGFAEANKIEFCRDSMNEDKDFKRVRIRKELLPILKNYNPKIVETLSNTAQILADENALIAELVTDSEKIQELINAEKLPVKTLENLSLTILNKILREWLSIKRGNLRNLELKHFEAIVRLIFTRKSGRIVELPNFQIIYKEGGNLHFGYVGVEK